MKKTIKSVFAAVFAVIMALSSLTVFAAEENQNIKWKYNDTEIFLEYAGVFDKKITVTPKKENQKHQVYYELAIPQSGYYLVSAKHIGSDFSIEFPEKIENGVAYGKLFKCMIENSGRITDTQKTICRFSAGKTVMGVYCLNTELEIGIEYLDKEITDFQVEQEDLDNVILGYNEVVAVDDENLLFLTHDMTDAYEGRYANYFRAKIVFLSGKVFDIGNTGLAYNVKGGELKEGKNTVTFIMAEELGVNKEFELTAYPPTHFIKNIEISNLDEFKTVKINKDGFVYGNPEKLEMTVTYADGTKETFTSGSWDGFIELDNGKKVYVTFCRANGNMSMDYRLRSREAIHFRVSIGDTDYIDEICTVSEFDVIGYRKRLDQNNLEEARKYTAEIKNSIEILKENTDNTESVIYYSADLLKTIINNVYKIIERIAGFELDYAITTFKILTENDLT